MKLFFITVFLILSTVKAITTELIWMLDDSYSIARDNYKHAKYMIDRVNYLIRNDERYADTTAFGLLEFGARITGVEHLTYDYDEFREQLLINRFGSAGQTKISTAFNYVNRRMFNDTKTVDRRVIAIITDGAPKPKPRFGGDKLIKAVNNTIIDKEVDRLVYIMVENSIGQQKANPQQFASAEGYDKSRNFVSFNFKRPPTPEEERMVFCKLIDCSGSTLPPTLLSTSIPTTMPTMHNLTSTPAPTGPVDTVTNSPTASPTAGAGQVGKTEEPTMSPTPFTFPPDFTWPPGMTFPPHTHAPHSHPHEHDDGLSAGAIAGIVLGVLALVLAIAALAYTRGNENN
jgi:uncharacterized protein YegL